jgi:hypothetical protein
MAVKAFQMSNACFFKPTLKIEQGKYFKKQIIFETFLQIL